MSKVRIEMTDHGRGRVWVDDAEVIGVTRVTFFAGVGGTNHVSIELLAEVIDITSMDCKVRKYVGTGVST